MKILVTGGCGFIGSHLVDKLVHLGHVVRVYDLLEPQVHRNIKPSFLNPDAEYIFRDIRDRERLKKALKSIEIIFHQASQVGIGQSMYKIEKYVSHNCLGTAVLLDLLVNTKNKIRKLIIASSMSLYGEGAYRCKICGRIYPSLRDNKQLLMRDWEMRCPECKRTVVSIPTPEEKSPFPTSIYATTKKSQEEMCLEIGRAYKIPTVALRYFNVYGPRQSLNNPYTGVCAIFLSQVKNNHPPLIFEDGRQSRDFVYVSDIVEANMVAMKTNNLDYDIFNVGTGSPHTILDIANVIILLCHKKGLNPKVTSKFRSGDIRHCYADISKISRKSGFRPKVSFQEGMRRLIEWSDTQKAVDLAHKAQQELKKRRLAQ